MRLMPPDRRKTDGSRHRHCHWRTLCLGRLADPAAAYLPGDHRPAADLLCGQPVHFHHGAAVGEQTAADPGAGCRSGAVRRPGSPGPGADCHRHRLRHHRPVSGTAAHLPGADRNRPRGWQGTPSMSFWADQLILLPILLPLLFAAALVLLSGRRQQLKFAINLIGTLALLATAITLFWFTDREVWPQGVGVYLAAN